MDVTDAPGWGHGLAPAKPNHPASPVLFFPRLDSADQDTAAADNSPAATAHDISWAYWLALPTPYLRLPAWARIATEARSSSHVRKIMKRVCMLSRRFASSRLRRAGAANPTEQEDTCELPPSKLPRVELFEPCQGELEVVGFAESAAGMANLVMRAKVDLANNMLALSTDSLMEEIKRFRNKRQLQTVPAKRRMDREFHLPADGVVGGYRLHSYDMIWPVLDKAAETSQQMDVRRASIAEISANLQEMRRNPRRRVAPQGIPELSDIADDTEDESILSLMKPPQLPTKAKSPTKREAQPTSPTGPQVGRLSDTMVQLLPARSPSNEPSPTKSSPPPTPVLETPVPRKIVTQSPALKSAASTSAPPEPTVFRAPGYDSSSLTHSSPGNPSPTKLSCPVAPTPSKGDGAQPSGTPTPRWAASCEGGSSLGLVDAIPPCTPRLPPLTLTGIDTKDPARFDFGPISPSFNSPCWPRGSPALSRRGNSADRAGRRRSEPLVRSCYGGYGAKAAARLSMSPQKLQPLNANTADTVTTLAAQPEHANTMEQREGLHTPDMTRSPQAAAGVAETPAISWARMMGRAPRTAAPGTPQTNRASAKGIFSVDMRRNPDIFGGAQAPSLPRRRSSVIEQLARIAEEGCDGRAKVMVTQENGRLFVRFKLPAKYGSMFPESQGFDESRFTTTPSISSSPRVIFSVKGPRISDQGGVASSNAAPAQSPAVAAERTQTTTVVSCCTAGQDKSPAVSNPSQHDTTVTVSTEQEKTLAVSDFTAERQTTTAVSTTEQDMTLVVSDFEKDTSTVSEQDKTLAVDDFAAEQDHTMAVSDLAPSAAGATEGLSTDETAVDQSVDDGHEVSMDSVRFAMDEDSTAVPWLEQVQTGQSFLDNEPKIQCTPAEAKEKSDSSSTEMSATPSTTSSGRARLASKDWKKAQQGCSRQPHDSPGRAYMREFIKRAKPRRLSTTETGSPIAIALAAERQPLGAKDPNADSPQKGKRKAEDEKDGQSPALGQKRARRDGKMAGQVDEVKDGERAQSVTAAEVKSDQGAQDAKDDDDDMAEAPTTRRSSRLRNQKRTLAAPRSAMATPVRGAGRCGTGRGAGLKATRAEQDVTHQTRVNTRRNRGNAEYPAQVLARQSSGPAEEAGGAGRGPAKGSKTVGWKEPLVSDQRERAKRGRPAKARVMQGEACVAKAGRGRAAKGPGALGAANAGRVTRSAARVQK